MRGGMPREASKACERTYEAARLDEAVDLVSVHARAFHPLGLVVHVERRI